MTDQIRISAKNLEEIFTEWDRRYREDPNGFMSEVDRLLRETSYSYGKKCALYFMALAKEIG